MVGIIIWGSTAKHKNVETGEFYCPSCRHTAPFQRMRVVRYFTLYFIPLFPTETLGEWVTCQHCNGEFESHVAELSADDIERALSPWQCPGCGNNNSASETYCLGCSKPRPIQQ